MPRQRMGLPKWLRMQIDSRKYNGVKWVSREKLIFSIPWKHASSNKWTLQNDAALFKDWAIHKGKYNEGQPPCPKRWKATFRCALNASRTINEYNDGEFDEDGCKLYQFSKDDKSEKSYENLTSHQELGDRDPGDLMDKETCKCATYELKVDGCEKKELQKCLKTKIKDEDRSIEKKGLELPETIPSSTIAPSFYEILSSLKKDEDSKIPAYHTAPYFNPYPNSNSLNSTQNHFTNTDYECQPYLSYLQVSHHLQTNLVKQEGTTSLRVCGSNDNRNDFDNSSSISRSSVHMNHREICPTNQQQDADYLERTSYQSLNPVSYASSVASSGSGDELRIAEEDLNAELSDSLSAEEGYTETRNVFTELQPWQDSQMNTSIIKQVINMDPFICDTSAFAYAHYPLNMKQPFYHNIMMGEGCAI